MPSVLHRVALRFLQSRAKGVSDLPESWRLSISRSGGTVVIRLLEVTKEVGHLKMDYLDSCQSWEVNNVFAPNGWGPLLFDVALEIAGEDGVVPDRHSNTSAAKAVWGFYLSSRRDVQKTWLPEDPRVDCLFYDEMDDSNPLDYRYTKRNQTVTKELRGEGKLVAG